MTTTLTISDLKALPRDSRDKGWDKAPRVHFWLKGQNVLDNLLLRGREPHALVRPLLAEVAATLGLTGFDPANVRWSRKAGCGCGCGCGCSPGFILDGVRHPEHGRAFDVFFDVTLAEPDEIGAYI